jgi:hypothetical protein
MNTEKKSKNLLMVMGILFVLLIIVAFLMFKLIPKNNGIDSTVEVELEETTDTNEEIKDDGASHPNIEGETTVFEHNEDPEVEIKELILSAPITLPNSYNLESAPVFRGVFEDNRIYVLAYGGQFYHYDYAAGKTFTYENLVIDTAVDSLTGNSIFTREIKDVDLNASNKEGEIGLYRVLKEYPEDELMFKIPENAKLQQSVFFKDYILMTFLNYDDASYFTKVIPIVGTQLDAFGKNLEKVFSVDHYELTTDGNRLLAYNAKSNELVELTNGKEVSLQKLNEADTVSSISVYKDSYLISYFNEEVEDSDAIIYNGKELTKGSFIEINFYDENYAFVTTGFNLNLLHLKTGRLDPLTDIAYNVVVTKDNVYYSNDNGEISKITIKKNAQ